MPYFPLAPEALVGRNDSKNPATTCKGITSSGRPCRRALALPGSRRRSNGSSINGVIAHLHEDGEIQEADFHCWQHKDQAEQRFAQESKDSGGKASKRRATELLPLQERSSIDTLVQRLGIDAESGNNSRDEGKKSKETKNPKPPRKTHTTDFATLSLSQAPHAERYNFVRPIEPQLKPKKPGFWASLCCMTGDDDDYVEIVRHKRRIQQAWPEMAESRPTEKYFSSSKPSLSARPSGAALPSRSPIAALPVRPQPQQQTSATSATNQCLSFIPQHLSPQTTSALLAELSKPISPHDEEGYIYIFWLTPQSNATPPESTARFLLAPHRPQHGRRISDVMTEFSFDGNDDEAESGSKHKRKTIMLKIGRANNVTRRMNEWQRQCGYALNLVRWYPYVPSAATPSPRPSPHGQSPHPLYPDLSQSPSSGARPSTDRTQSGQRRESGVVRKISCVKRVERLIHLELAANQVKRQCEACGKEHREWFEVEASHAGIKAVDETVRRWVGWAERLEE